MHQDPGCHGVRVTLAAGGVGGRHREGQRILDPVRARLVAVGSLLAGLFLMHGCLHGIASAVSGRPHPR